LSNWGSQASDPFRLTLSKPRWKTLALAPFDKLSANGRISVRAEPFVFAQDMPVEALLEHLGARALRQAQGERPCFRSG
jgi:hypothetical protein